MDKNKHKLCRYSGIFGVVTPTTTFIASYLWCQMLLCNDRNIYFKHTACVTPLVVISRT